VYIKRTVGVVKRNQKRAGAQGDEKERKQNRAKAEASLGNITKRGYYWKRKGLGIRENANRRVMFLKRGVVQL